MLKMLDLPDEVVMQLLQELADKDKRAVPLVRLKQEVSSFMGQEYTGDHVRVRVQHLERDGLARIIKVKDYGKASWYVIPADKDYPLPDDIVDESRNPISKREVEEAVRRTKVGDTLMVRISGVDIDGAPMKKDMTVKVAKKYPFICLLSNRKTVQWWEMARYYRRPGILNLT